MRLTRLNGIGRKADTLGVHPSEEGADVTPVVGEIIGWEFLLVIGIIALLFGSSQLPKLARSMGSAKTEFEKGLKTGADADDGEDKTEPKPKA